MSNNVYFTIRVMVNNSNHIELLPVKWGKIVQFIRSREIVLLRANGNESEIFLSSGRIVNSESSLKNFETETIRTEFLRAHKTWFVNKHWILTIDLEDRVITLIDKIPESVKSLGSIPIARQRARELKSGFG